MSLILSKINLEAIEDAYDYWPLSKGERLFFLPCCTQHTEHDAFGFYSRWSHEKTALNPVFFMHPRSAVFLHDTDSGRNVALSHDTKECDVF